METDPMREIGEPGFSDEVRRKLLWQNAVRVYGPEDRVGIERQTDGGSGDG